MSTAAKAPAKKKGPFMAPFITQTVTTAGFALLPFAVVGSKAEAVILALTGILLLYAAVREDKWRSILQSRLLWLFGGLVAYGLLTAPFAVVPGDALELSASLAGLFLALVIALDVVGRLEDPVKKAFAATAGSGYAFGCLLLAVEFFGGMPITHFLHYQGGKGPALEPVELNAALSVLAILVWPFAATGQRFLSVVALGAATVLVLQGEMVTARIALGLGGVAFVLVQWFGKYVVRLLGVLAVLFVAFAPVIDEMVPFDRIAPVAEGKMASVAHRLCIWQFVGDRIAEKPLFGWGLDSSRSIPGGQVDCVEDGPSLSLHPHDAALQVWLELGIVGAFVFASVIALAFRAAASMPAGMPMAGAAAAIVSALVLASLSYGIWQNWWIGALGLIAMTCRAAMPKPIAAPKPAPKPAPKKPAPPLPAGASPQTAPPAAAGPQALAQIPTAKVPAALAKK